MSDLIPARLLAALESGRCVLFLGAGAGAYALDSAGGPAPDGGQLARDIASHFGIDAGDEPDLSLVAQVASLRHGRKDLDSYLSKRLAGLRPTGPLMWIPTRRWAAIFTTNYDDAVERAYEECGSAAQIHEPISCAADFRPNDDPFHVPVVHLHGALFGPAGPRVLITQDDYAQFRDRRRMLFQFLQFHHAASTLLYVGYSNRDVNWKALLTELREEYAPKPLPISYRAVPATPPLEAEILKAAGVETIDAPFDILVAEATRRLSSGRLDAAQTRALRERVPTELAAAFDANPASLTRLLDSWTYVNQAPFHEPDNLTAFLEGDRPNWGLVNAGRLFERDIETPLFEELFDAASSPGQPAKTFLALAPAGYGMTTLLMSLAARIAKWELGPVFMLKPSKPLLAGDIEYATTLFDDKRPFFIVDNAADSFREISAAVTRVKELRSRACFLLGERLNEWRQLRRTIGAKEYRLEKLSDGEIERLLDFLEANRALKRLTDLDRGLQVSVIKEKHEKELLVAMKEATEGVAFDSIIEDEYRAISTQFSRRMYAAVCSAYHLGMPIRDTLLAAILGVSVTDMYAQSRAETDGVIEYDVLNEHLGEYAARSRHSLIAEIVWRRCVSAEERSDLSLRLIRSLNVNYHTDAVLLDALVRSDDHVDSLGTVEQRDLFFEEASRKQPDSPYVLQHWARMLLRADRPEAALAVITRALAIAPNALVLHHTHGKILEYQALTLEVEVARRRLVQSEAAYRKVRRINPKDSYAYSGLAELYLGWAKRIADTAEEAAYLSKAEDAIAEGLRVVRDRENLYIVSAKLQDWIGNHPEAIASLRRATTAAETPGAGRYLLGRALLRDGKPHEARDILRPLIDANPGDARAGLAYAEALLAMGEPFGKVLALLRLSAAAGQEDPRHVAMLGGLLVLTGSVEESAVHFSDALERNFSFNDLVEVRFRPRDPLTKQPVSLDGKIIRVAAGYALVESPGYPKFFVRGSKIEGLVLRVGLRVSFQVGFCARGAVALSVQQA